MSTRAMIYVLNGKNEPLAAIYHHHDGYITGVGHMLGQLLSNRRLCNGFGQNDDGSTLSNGIECLAATLIMLLKRNNELGNVYLYRVPFIPHDAPLASVIRKLDRYANDCGCEYTYYVMSNGTDEGKIELVANEIGFPTPDGELRYRGEPSGILDVRDAA